MKYTILIFWLLILPFASQAQENLSKYFDDGGAAETSRLFKVGLDPRNGELAFSFEHQVIRDLSIEWAAGPVSMARQSKLYDDIRNRSVSSGLGFNMSANVRIYMKGYYEQFYIGFQPRLNFLAGKTYTDIVFFSCGYQIPLQGKLVLDIYGGLGVRTYKEDDVTIGVITIPGERTSDFMIPLQIKLGYAF